jgi:hypothetical protein
MAAATVSHMARQFPATYRCVEYTDVYISITFSFGTELFPDQPALEKSTVLCSSRNTPIFSYSSPNPSQSPLACL